MEAAGTQSDDGFFGFPVPDSQKLGSFVDPPRLDVLLSASVSAVGRVAPLLVFALHAYTCPGPFEVHHSICFESSAASALGQSDDAISLSLLEPLLQTLASP